MREIKFRAWCNGSMLNDDEIIIVNGTAREYNHGDLTGYVESHLMQYTGLKDKNGVEIYEGDVVKGNHKDNFIIEAINGGLQMYNISYYGQEHNELIAEATCNAQTKSWLMNSEVIGNIYQNPELL